MTDLARTEYYDDPAAPEPNSLVVATSAVVVNDAGHILLQRRTDSGNWACPGGAIDLGESLTDSVVREVKEKTGLDVEVSGLVGTYTARIPSGTLQTSSESTDLRFTDPTDLDALPIHHTQRLRLDHSGLLW